MGWFPACSSCVFLSLFVFTLTAVVHSPCMLWTVHLDSLWSSNPVPGSCIGFSEFDPSLFTLHLSSLKCFWSLQDLKKDNSLKQSHGFRALTSNAYLFSLRRDWFLEGPIAYVNSTKSQVLWQRALATGKNVNVQFSFKLLQTFPLKNYLKFVTCQLAVPPIEIK